MAYLAFNELVGGDAYAPASARAAEPDRQRAREAGLSALEWSVVAIARRDRLATLREPGAISIAMGAVFGGHRDPRLADPRLEALRRMAVLTWHRGYAVAPSEVRAFLAAGFSLDQYETVVSSIGAGRAAARNERFRR